MTLLRADPGNAALRRDSIARAIAERHFDTVSEIVDTHVQAHPDDALASFDAATLALAQQDYPRAARLLETLLGQGVSNAGVLTNLGLCRYCEGNFTGALEPLETAYALGERSSGLIRLLVSTLHHVGRIEDAVAIAEQNAAAAESDAAVAGVFALAYLDAEMAGPAQRWAQSALQRNADCVDALVTEGTLNIVGMRIADADARFTRALALRADTGRAWLGLGTLALLARNPGRAREMLEKALQTLGGHVGTWHLLAWTQLTSGDLDGARAAFETALAINHNFAESHGGLATIAALRGERAEAERLIEVARRLDPDALAGKFAAAILASRPGDSGAIDRVLAQSATQLSQNADNALTRVLLMSVQRRR